MPMKRHPPQHRRARTPSSHYRSITQAIIMRPRQFWRGPCYFPRSADRGAFSSLLAAIESDRLDKPNEPVGLFVRGNGRGEVRANLHSVVRIAPDKGRERGDTGLFPVHEQTGLVVLRDDGADRKPLVHRQT